MICKKYIKDIILTIIIIFYCVTFVFIKYSIDLTNWYNNKFNNKL